MNAPHGKTWTSQLRPGLESAAISPSSRGVRYGDGVFVTLGIHDAVLLDAELQMDRLRTAAVAIGLEPPARFESPSGAARTLAALVAEIEPGVRFGVARLQWYAGPGPRGFGRESVRAEAIVDLSPRPTARSVSLVVLQDGDVPLPALPRYKTCSALANILCAREALHRGAEAAVRVDSGLLLETASANLFWIRDGVLATPASSLPLYSGSVRERIMECAPTVGLRIDEGMFTADCLERAETIFLTNAARGIEVVRRVESRIMEPPPAVLAELTSAVETRRLDSGIPLGGAMDADA